MVDLDRNYDVVVIGSGPAGSTACKELTERGLEVLLLEAGRDITPADFIPPKPSKPRAMTIGLGGRIKAGLSGQYVQARRAMFKPQTSPFLVKDSEHPYTTDAEPFLWIRGRQLGGRFHAYGRVLLRSSDHEFKAASHDGIGVDWPIEYKDIEPYYEKVEEYIGVYGTPENLSNLPDSKFRGTSNFTEAEKEFKKNVESQWPERKVVPWRWAAPNPHRIPVGVYLARQTGNLTTRTDSVVSKIIIDSKTGRATGVQFIDRLTKKPYQAKANIVMVCASAIESVRILFNSACANHPNGVGNSSGLLGKYFMDQTPSLLFASDPKRLGYETPVDPAPADGYFPPVGGVYIPRWDNLEDRTNPEFKRGWAVQGTIGRLPVPEGTPSSLGLMGFGEMLPYENNKISIDPRKKDAWGIPAPRITMRTTANEHAIMRAQMNGLRDMALANGYRINFVGSTLGLDSKKIWPDADPFSRAIFRIGVKYSLAIGAAIHECGGARMGTDPKNSVLNPFNQVWDSPNIFVTDAASYPSNGAVGPTLTIMAMTARACEYAADEYAKGRI